MRIAINQDGAAGKMGSFPRFSNAAIFVHALDRGAD
jgi:hypothetical protein